MDCEEVQNNLPGFLLHQMEDGEAKALNAHLFVCDRCHLLGNELARYYGDDQDSYSANILNSEYMSIEDEVSSSGVNLWLSLALGLGLGLGLTLFIQWLEPR